MKQLKLFWCSTPSGEADYFVVAPSQSVAIAYFAYEHGADLSPATRVEEVLRVPARDRHLLDRVVDDPSDCPRTPSMEALAHWGIQFNENFYVFHYNGRIFRPKAAVRDAIRTRARQRLARSL